MAVFWSRIDKGRVKRKVEKPEKEKQRRKVQVL
jgi:hypothetical protein